MPARVGEPGNEVAVNGIVVQQATPQDLYDRPTDQRLATFVGHANLLPGVLTGDKVTIALGELATRPYDGICD